MHIRGYEQADNDRLVKIWLAAVRATHPFLSEDDIGAAAFHRKCGFLPVGRSELDGYGKPSFPLIHMAQPA